MLNKFPITLMIIAFLTLPAKSQNTQSLPCEANETSYGLACNKQVINFVGQEKITVKIYTKEKPGKTINKTFVVVHADEIIGLDAAKQAIAEDYGRLVEIVPNAPNGKRKRFLYFGANKKSCIDPNRIYSKRGINKDLGDNDCKADNPLLDTGDEIFKFGQNFLDIVTMGDRYNFIVGVHNNLDSLSLDRWSKNDKVTGKEFKSAFGIFKANDHKTNSVFKTNGKNFVLATNGTVFGKLLEKGIYYAALQMDRDYLTMPANSSLDDGSMSIYFGSTLFENSGKPYNYLVVEAGSINSASANKEWQKEVIKKVIEIDL